eukprot:Rmarinus@m.1618
MKPGAQCFTIRDVSENPAIVRVREPSSDATVVYGVKDSPVTLAIRDPALPRVSDLPTILVGHQESPDWVDGDKNMGVDDSTAGVALRAGLGLLGMSPPRQKKGPKAPSKSHQPRREKRPKTPTVVVTQENTSEVQDDVISPQCPAKPAESLFSAPLDGKSLRGTELNGKQAPGIAHPQRADRARVSSEAMKNSDTSNAVPHAAPPKKDSLFRGMSDQKPSEDDRALRKAADRPQPANAPVVPRLHLEDLDTHNEPKRQLFHSKLALREKNKALEEKSKAKEEERAKQERLLALRQLAREIAAASVPPNPEPVPAPPKTIPRKPPAPHPRQPPPQPTVAENEGGIDAIIDDEDSDVAGTKGGLHRWKSGPQVDTSKPANWEPKYRVKSRAKELERLAAEEEKAAESRRKNNERAELWLRSRRKKTEATVFSDDEGAGLSPSGPSGRSPVRAAASTVTGDNTLDGLLDDMGDEDGSKAIRARRKPKKDTACASSNQRAAASESVTAKKADDGAATAKSDAEVIQGLLDDDGEKENANPTLGRKSAVERPWREKPMVPQRECSAFTRQAKKREREEQDGLERRKAIKDAARAWMYSGRKRTKSEKRKKKAPAKTILGAPTDPQSSAKTLDVEDAYDSLPIRQHSHQRAANLSRNHVADGTRPPEVQGPAKTSMFSYRMLDMGGLREHPHHGDMKTAGIAEDEPPKTYAPPGANRVVGVDYTTGGVVPRREGAKLGASARYQADAVSNSRIGEHDSHLSQDQQDTNRHRSLHENGHDSQSPHGHCDHHPRGHSVGHIHASLGHHHHGSAHHCGHMQPHTHESHEPSHPHSHSLSHNHSHSSDHSLSRQPQCSSRSHPRSSIEHGQLYHTHHHHHHPGASPPNLHRSVPELGAQGRYWENGEIGGSKQARPRVSFAGLPSDHEANPCLTSGMALSHHAPPSRYNMQTKDLAQEDFPPRNSTSGRGGRANTGGTVARLERKVVKKRRMASAVRVNPYEMKRRTLLERRAAMFAYDAEVKDRLGMHTSSQPRHRSTAHENESHALFARYRRAHRGGSRDAVLQRRTAGKVSKPPARHTREAPVHHAQPRSNQMDAEAERERALAHRQLYAEMLRKAANEQQMQAWQYHQQQMQAWHYHQQQMFQQQQQHWQSRSFGQPGQPDPSVLHQMQHQEWQHQHQHQH